MGVGGCVDGARPVSRQRSSAPGHGGTSGSAGRRGGAARRRTSRGGEALERRYLDGRFSGDRGGRHARRHGLSGSGGGIGTVGTGTGQAGARRSRKEPAGRGLVERKLGRGGGMAGNGQAGGGMGGSTGAAIAGSTGSGGNRALACPIREATQTATRRLGRIRRRNRTSPARATRGERASASR